MANAGAVVHKMKPPVPRTPRHNPTARAFVRLDLDDRPSLTVSTLVGRLARSCFFSDMVVVVVLLEGDEEHTNKRTSTSLYVSSPGDHKIRVGFSDVPAGDGGPLSRNCHDSREPLSVG
jgi:hypothetical protein